MIYLSNPWHQSLVGNRAFGVMASFSGGTAVSDLSSDRVWAGDNGLFSSRTKFTDDRFFVWLDKRLAFQSSCLFIVAPDVMGDAEATLERSKPYFDALHNRGWKVAFVAQDGLEHKKDKIPWDQFEALFIGASTEWKLSRQAFEIVEEARARGKWLHLGRVNTLSRLRFAATGGYDSVDGTMLAFGPDVNVLKMVRWLGNPDTVYKEDGHEYARNTAEGYS